jgi:hypothetical protein
LGDVDVNAEIFTNVVAKKNRNVNVKNAIVGMNRKGIDNKKEYVSHSFFGDYIPS